MIQFRPSLFVQRTCMAGLLVIMTSITAHATDRDKLRAFLVITGFDVAIESLQQNAMAGPGLAGDAPGEFGAEWVRLAEEIFDPSQMIERTIDMMAAVMPEDLVDYGAAFYASDLGQLLVEVENASHMTSDAERYVEAEKLVEAMMQGDSPRIQMFRDLGDAVGGVEQSVRSAIEIQYRYYLAAMNAGTVDLEMSAEDLRLVLESQADGIRQNVQIYSMLGSAYTYKDISDAALGAYVEALMEPKMQQVYEILNAIQFEVMAERYEDLAIALAELAPQQDL